MRRFRNLSSMSDIVDAFEAVGTTQPVRLTDSQKALPLHDDLHHVGLEASDD